MYERVTPVRHGLQLIKDAMVKELAATRYLLSNYYQKHAKIQGDIRKGKAI